MKTKRVLYYDLLNIAACFAVICIHHNGLAHTYAANRIWKECLIAEVGGTWAVPIFLMLSGANLMNYRKKYSTRVFFQKRIEKVVFPWIIWSFIALGVKIYIHQYDLEGITVKSILGDILSCKIEGVYWFFPMIISVYLMMPILSLMTDEKFRKTLWYLVGSFLLFNATIPLLAALVEISWNTSIGLPVSGYVIFAITGYLLATQNLKKSVRIRIYVLGIISFFVRYFGIYVLSTRDGQKNYTFFSYTHIYSYGLAIAVFVLFQYIPWNQLFERVKKYEKINLELLIQKLSGCSFGIYLIHKLVMQGEIYIFHMSESDFIWRTGACFLTYSICLVIVIILKHIPLMEKIVP